MARGRKPRPNSQRRGGLIPTGSDAARAIVVDGHALEMPARVAANPEMAEKWASYIELKRDFAPEDAPLLEAWCFWAVVADQCARDLDQNPEPELIRKMERATTMLMRLGDALNLSPISRLRAGLISAVTVSTQADVVEKTRAEFAAMKEADG